MMFVWLTGAYPTTRVLFVNINSIKLIHPNDGDCNTLIEFVDGETMTFQETFDVVKARIKAEVATERGY